ncbi:MAG: phosphate acyltransferase PlsX [Phycisphaerales bacterium]|nr:MAG: phosphate acyltransferase PlsX [Phycisphaerales bacterium]
MPARIGLDAMGGDQAPHAIVSGAVQALSDADDVEVVLVGDESRVKAELDAIDGLTATDRVRIVHASQVVPMGQAPLDALRQNKDSSIVRVAELAADGQVDAVISAGNTGAFAAAAQLKMRPLRCISRPGIAVAIPSFHGPVVLCDCGANIQAKPHQLHEYAVMSTLYAERVLGVVSPRVGLLSVGGESQKGTELVKQTHALLHGDANLEFVGNVEGQDLFSNVCQVAVCDGFVGNILLKLVEGLAESLFPTISREFEDEDPQARERFDSALKRVWSRHDFSEYGGAPLLGVNGVCIICHGRSGERAIRNAVRAAAKFLSHNFNEAIVERLGDK